MSASQSSAEKGEPNLVPILDMVFQLITFFMLVVNFKANQVDNDLSLPILGSAQPVEESPSELLVLNIRKGGELVVRGKVEQQVDLFFRLESQVQRNIHRLAASDPIPVTVVVRADKSLRVKQMMGVVDSCRKYGFDKFDFVVVRAAPGSGGL